MQTAFNAAAAVQAGHLDVVVASGVESMSRVPMGSNLTANGFEGFSPKLYEHWDVVPQGISAEVIADEWDLSRDGARRVLVRVAPPRDRGDRRGRFEREIVPVEVGAAGAAVPRRRRREPAARHVAREARGVAAAFKEEGRITAGNSSAIVDGAAAMLVTSEAAASRLGLGLGRGSSPFGCGVDPYGCCTEPARVRAGARRRQVSRGTTSR
jgi:acetyl-CoA acetyltransferase